MKFGMFETAGIGAITLWFGVVVAVIVGWVLNAIKLITISLGGFSGNEVEIIIRAVGAIFIPFGGVAGWF